MAKAITETNNSPTKKEVVLRLLKRSRGASVSDIEKATNWQPHTVRAAISRLRKEDINITRHKNASKKLIYKVVEA